MAGLAFTATTRDGTNDYMTGSTSEEVVLEVQAPSNTDMVIDGGHISAELASGFLRCRLVLADVGTSGTACETQHTDQRIDTSTYPTGVVAKKETTVGTIRKTFEVATVTSGWQFPLKSIVIPRGKAFVVLAAASTGTPRIQASASGSV